MPGYDGMLDQDHHPGRILDRAYSLTGWRWAMAYATWLADAVVQTDGDIPYS